MTTLAANLPRPMEQGNRNEYPVKASTKIYEGSAVGIEVGSGYARPLASGDLFVGFCEALADNSAVAVNGAIKVRVHESGKVHLPVASLAITDIGKPVYASDDNAFTLTASTNVYIGKVVRYESTGFGVVAFDAKDKGGIVTPLTDNSTGAVSATIAALVNLDTLTDSSTGTPSTTIAEITSSANAGSADVAPTKNAIASLAAQLALQKAANTVLVNAVASLAAKVNELIKIVK